jgi:hypothetical protein
VLGKHNRNAPVCGLPEGTCSAGFPQSVAKTVAKNESIKVDCTKHREYIILCLNCSAKKKTKPKKNSEETNMEKTPSFNCF